MADTVPISGIARLSTAGAYIIYYKGFSLHTKHTELNRSQTPNLRSRVAWMYYVEELTQSQIATHLNIGRITVQRLLAEAKNRNEISINVNTSDTAIIELERNLERVFELDRCIIAPLSAKTADASVAIAAALGQYISEILNDGMSVGVGWGKTLCGSIAFTTGRTLKDFQVISLLGGISQARRFNPAEFAWQLAESFQGEGFLIPAPAIVDSVTTRTALVEKCGLNSIFTMARKVDVALLSVGGAEPSSTAYRVGYLSDDERQSITSSGAVGDLLFHFFDINGAIVEHEINDRIVSVDIESLKNIPTKVLASGGADKLNSVYGALALISPQVLVTDEFTARDLIDLKQTNSP